MLLKNAWLLDCGHDFVRKNVLLENDRIAAVTEEVPACGEVLDLEGCTLMPGFVDAHVHLIAGPGGFPDASLREWVRNGITTVRDMGILNETGLEEYAAGFADAPGPEWPRVVKAGKFIDVEGGYGAGPAPGGRANLVISTPEEAARAVSQNRAAGADFIKIGIQDTEMVPGMGLKPRMTPEEIRAITGSAHALGLKVSAHLYRSDTLEELLALGLDDAGHVPKDRMPDELVREAVEHGCPFTTTVGDPDFKFPKGIFPDELMALMEKQDVLRRAAAKDNILRIWKAGGTVAVGTDYMCNGLGMVPAAIPVYELVHLTDIGMTVQQAVTCATMNGALVCGTGEEEGSILAGKYANLIAVPGRPDASFRSLKAPALVINRGKLIRNDLK